MSGHVGETNAETSKRVIFGIRTHGSYIVVSVNLVSTDKLIIQPTNEMRDWAHRHLPETLIPG